MIYLHWYLGIGISILAVFILFHQQSKKKDDESFIDLQVNNRLEQKKLWYRLLNNIIEPALVSLLAVLICPIIVFFEVKQIIFKESVPSSLDEPEFAVTHTDLLHKVSIPDIERSEMVVDPLGAVPHLPFGHLNTAWKKFLENKQPDDSIWTFSAKWTQWGHIELRQGYVVVIGEKIGSHFITMRKYLDEEGKLPAKNKKNTGFDLIAYLRKHAD